MRAVVQRVASAAVAVDGETKAQIGEGLLVLLGVGRQDSEGDAMYLADKVANLRVFPDQDDRLNLSVKDVNGEILVVSQFTIYGDCSRGLGPSLTKAAQPELACGLYSVSFSRMQAQGLKVETGVFQAHMEVSLIKNGPVTLIMSSRSEF